MSGLRYWNAARPKYVDGENWEHSEAKQRIRFVCEARGYDVYLEYPLTVQEHKGVGGVCFPVDGYAVSRTCPETERFVFQIDGEYHRASEIQQGRTKNRDDTLREYCETEGIRYITFNHANVIEDILHEYTDAQIARKLGIDSYVC